MIEPSLQIGGGNWANKSDSLLGYHKDGANFYADELTFSRNSLGSYTDANGLIQSMPYNLLQQSNTFSTTWFNDQTSQASGQAGYDGTNNAWLLNSTGGFIQQNISLNGLYTFSVYAKKGTLDGIRLRINAATDSNCYINLNDGTEIIPNTGVYLSVISVGSGWYRISLAINDSTISDVRFYPISLAPSSATGSIYIQDAQVNQGSTALPYFATTTRLNLARVDYKDNVNGSLLLEKQSTNLITYSEDFSNVVWTQNSTDSTANTATSPDGTQNADTIASISASPRVVSPVALFTSTNNVSIFVKYVSQQWVMLMSGGAVNDYANFDIQNGVIGSVGSTSSNAQIQNFGNGWYRISVTFSGYAGNTNLYFGFIASGTSAWNTFDPNYNKSLYAWGCQIENSSYPTSYIKSEGAATTRLADSCSKTGISDKINSEEGVLYAEIAALANDGTSRLIGLSNGTSTKRINIYYDTSSNSIYGLLLNSSVQGITSFTLSDSTNFAKIAFKYKENDFALWVNGTEVDTDSSGTTFTSDTLNKLSFDRADGVAPFYGKVKQLQVYDTALTDTELATLTTL